MFRIITNNGLNLNEGISDILKNVHNRLEKSGKLISHTLTQSTRRHIQKTYPGSNHWNPDKVNDGQSANGAKSYGSTEIAIPGATRAYHDITILPKIRKHLAIPMNKAAYGKKPVDFNDLFVVKKRTGKMFLAHNLGNSIQFMFVLAQKAFLKQDLRLLPSDNTYADNIFARIKAYLTRN